MIHFTHNQLYRSAIYLNETRMMLTSEKAEVSDSYITLYELKEKNADKFLDLMQGGEYGKVVNIYGTHPEETIEFFKNNLIHLQAAGGLVENPHNEILFIFRHGKWDLPKGKPEEGENLISTALREVMEECGISKLQIVDPLPNTYHIYKDENRNYVLKECVWFFMVSKKWKELELQTDEGITDAKWVKHRKTDEILKNAYPSIRDLVEYYLKP